MQRNDGRRVKVFCLEEYPYFLVSRKLRSSEEDNAEAVSLCWSFYTLSSSPACFQSHKPSAMSLLRPGWQTLGKAELAQLQHWWASHGQMCHFSCLAEKLKWSFPPALNFMVCCSSIKKSIKLHLMEAGPESCLYLCHPRQVLSAVPECRRAVECGQLTNVIFHYRNPAQCMAAALLSLVAPYGWALLYPN